MTRHHRRSGAETTRGSERGATMIEAAFALPILFLLLLGLADLGRGVQQKSQATSSAADGARAAIVMGNLTDGCNQAVVDAVQRTLPKKNLDCTNVTVTCLTPGGSNVACSLANHLTDRVRVEVELPWKPVSPVGALIPDDFIAGSSTMSLIAQPTPRPSSESPASGP